MDQRVRDALGRNGTIDMTTTGRRTGLPRRIEIYLHSIDGHLVISGRPTPGRTRAWIHNIRADPRVTIHLKRGLVADIDGTAREVTDAPERRRLLERVAANWGRTDVDVMMASSPLIEVTLPGFPA